MYTVSSEVRVPSWMPRLSVSAGHIIVPVLMALIWKIVHDKFAGPGHVSLLFFYIERDAFANILGFATAFLYGKLCLVNIPPNHQGIQLFLGMQTGIVWGEGSFNLTPWPVITIGRIIPIEHISFTVAAQNRTSEGHQMIVCATGRAEPQNVFYLAKIPERDSQGRTFQELLNEQLIGVAMMALGSYINANNRSTLFRFSQYDVSRLFTEKLSEAELYGLKVTLRTTKAVEVNQKTMDQFDYIARQVDMETAMGQLKKLFPLLSEKELYAVYASQVGLNPYTMSYIVQGQGNNILLGGQGQSQ